MSLLAVTTKVTTKNSTTEIAKILILAKAFDAPIWSFYVLLPRSRTTKLKPNENIGNTLFSTFSLSSKRNG
jgi:hypothetical protein